MVSPATLLRRFRADTSGLAVTEMLVVLPVLLMIWGGMIEFGVAMYQWNQTVKALQIGARLAAVSSPLTDIGSLVPSGAAGDPAPNDAASVSCGATATACETAPFNRLLYGGDMDCDTVTNGVAGVCDIARFIGADNLLVTYRRSGLGYVGRPFGPVLTVTLEARNLTFDFLMLDSLVPALGTIGIPAHPVSITSEDLSDCDGACS